MPFSRGAPARAVLYTPTPIIYGDLFYALADNGVLSAYDAKTGVNIYQQRLPTSFSASPVAANGKLYLSSEDGDVFVVKAGRQYELLSRNTMGQPLMATPALTDGMADRAWRDSYFNIRSATVNNHVKHILTKFDAHTRLEAIRHAESVGVI